MNLQTLRYCERRGLLKPERTSSNYRVYTEETVIRVRFIKRAQALGFTLEEIKEAVGDKMVVLDLLRAIDFLPNFPTAELLEFARKAIDMFAPRLILGISDEISELGEIEKVEAVSELVDKICGLPD